MYSPPSLIEICAPQNVQEWEDMFALRWRVLRAPLGMPVGSERDSYEDCACHQIAIHQCQIVGAARLRQLSAHQGSIAYVVVAPGFQRQGIGSRLISRLVAIAQQQQLTSIRVMSRIEARSFYERCGFQSIGQPLDSLGIPHQFMQLTLADARD